MLPNREHQVKNWHSTGQMIVDRSLQCLTILDTASPLLPEAEPSWLQMAHVSSGLDEAQTTIRLSIIGRQIQTRKDDHDQIPFKNTRNLKQT